MYGKSLEYIKEQLPGVYGSELSLVFVDAEASYAAIRLRRTLPLGEFAPRPQLYGIGLGFAEVSTP